MSQRELGGVAVAFLMAIFFLGCTERSAAPAAAPPAEEPKVEAPRIEAKIDAKAAGEAAHHHGEGGEGHHHGDEHHHHALGADAVLQLNDGEKWATDEILRAGMKALRDELAGSLDAIHHDRFTPEEFTTLAGKVDAHLKHIVENCKLSPEADVQFHILLAGLMGGSQAMKEGDARKEGAVRILESLNAYPNFFDHPGWTPIEH